MDSLTFEGSYQDNDLPGKTDSELFKPGDLVAGRYRIRKYLGSGSYGDIYFILLKELEIPLALKVLRKEHFRDAGLRDSFREEIEVLMLLEAHPFLVSLRWVDDYAGSFFLAMDYVEPDKEGNVSLKDHLAGMNGPIDDETALRWAIQFCIGMEYILAHGIDSHRDIKPANILIGGEGMLKISDFGLAKASIGRSMGISTLSVPIGDSDVLCSFQGSVEGIVGTPGYIAPEVYEGRSADIRSDIYSFGLVLWQMASGSTSSPFIPQPSCADIKSYLELVHMRQVTESVPEVRSSYRDVIDRCLELDPSRRYTDFIELRHALERIYGKPVNVPDIPRNDYFWNIRGNTLLSLGRNEDALECFETVIELNPRHLYGWTNKGVALGRMGKHDEALKCLDTALKIDTGSAMAWNSKGFILHKSGKQVEAIECLDVSTETDPDLVIAWHNKATALGTLGRYDDAIQNYDKALDLDPLFTPSWNCKASALKRRGSHTEAYDCIKRALEIDPLEMITWVNKGTVEEALGKYEDAMASYKHSLELNPSSRFPEFVTMARERMKSIEGR